LNQSADSYRVQDTHGKSQLDLIIQVYNGAIAAYRAAAECYRNEDYETGYEQMEKGKNFVVHLYTTLDSDKGGGVAENLGKLYSFIVSQTDVVEATKDLSEIDDIITVLTDLREGWSALKQQEPKNAPPAAVGTPSGDGFATSG
jgi:flagellar protein FliS